MSKVDEELTHRLRRAERPVETEGLFEGLARRRRRRRTIQRLQAGALAVVVLVGTGAGFVALRRAFDEGERDVGDPVELPTNGEIVFSRTFPDGSSHLFAVTPRRAGERRITPPGTASYTEPSISPDGRHVAVVHSIPSFSGAFPAGSAVIATVPIEGGPPTWLTEPEIVHDPRWSPDGAEIVFDGQVPGSSDGIHVLRVATREVRLVIRSSGRFMADAPAWSPDGSRIVFTGYDHDAGEQPDLYSITPGGSGLKRLTRTPDIAERSPDWSPDGSAIVYIASDPENASDTIRLITPDGEAMTTSFGVEGALLADVGWSPDGRFLVFLSDLALHDGDQDGDLDVWTVRSTGEEGTLVNYTDEGVSGVSWQPLPATADPPPTVSPTHEPEVRDIGLGFPLCDIRMLDGIDWYGDGAPGAAWTGARAGEDGRCPADGSGEYVVAADLDGDGVAEPGGMGFLASCLFCRPYATTDLNGDGVLELVVAEEASSTVSYSIHEVSLPTSERSPGIYNLFVAAPGAPNANVPAGEPLRLVVGGDEGFSGGIRCERFPEAPVLVYTWFSGQVDADTDLEVHTTRIQLGEDGAFHVLASEDSTAPRDAPPEVPTEPACDIDWHPAP